MARDALALVNLPASDVYFDLIKASLSEAARKAFERFPASYEYQDESLRKSFYKRKAEGDRAKEKPGVKPVHCCFLMETRDLPLSDPQRRRVERITDSEELRRLVVKTGTIKSAGDLFDS